MATKNPCGKSRPATRPYEVWQSADGSWTWKVLKKYQSPEKEAENPYARWFVSVSSPYTFGMDGMGDTYVSEITRVATLVSTDYDD